MTGLRVLTAPILKKIRANPAFKEAILFIDWDSIVGAELCLEFKPLKITKVSGERRMLVTASSSGMLTIRYLEFALLEKINRFFGGAYIASIRARQGVLASSPPKALKIPEKSVELPEPADLEEALKRLERGISRERHT